MWNALIACIACRVRAASEQELRRVLVDVCCKQSRMRRRAVASPSKEDGVDTSSENFLCWSAGKRLKGYMDGGAINIEGCLFSVVRPGYIDFGDRVLANQFSCSSGNSKSRDVESRGLRPRGSNPEGLIEES